MIQLMYMIASLLSYLSFIFPVGVPSEGTPSLQKTRISSILEKAKLAKSSSFLMIKNRQILAHLNAEGKPIEAHSITKSMISLGIGILVDQGKIRSIDQSISDWYPEWKGSAKEKITLRHVLTHTSGLQAESSGQEIYQNGDGDCIALALSATLKSNPGKEFFYNNKAVNLLSGVIEKVSGKRADIWIQENLFNPLDIKKISWSLDPKGHAYAHAGLKIRAIDLAKIGQMILDQGIWNGKRLIGQEWLKASTKLQSPHSTCGFLWWIWDHPLKAYAAIGYRGQYLIVVPQSKVLVVRQTDATEDPASSFDQLPELLFQCLIPNVSQK